MLATYFKILQRTALVGFILIGLTGRHQAHGQGSVAVTDTLPSQYYYTAVYDIYRGEYRDAQRTLMREARSSVRIGVTQRWIDAICYHALWGEVLYHQGQPAAALEQFNEACAMFLQYPNWVLSIEFREAPRADAGMARKVLPWGPSTRKFVLGDVPSQMMISFGDDLNTQSQTAQQGGVLRQRQFWQIDAVEIIRATALAIRRRNELLGPLAPYDPLSRDLVNKLSARITPPNHWSNVWADLLLGLAYAGQGNLDQAFQRLQRAERMAGQFDHPLTCISLLEQGRLAMEAGKFDNADRLFLEASISGIYYEDPGVIDEAFRYMAMNRLGAPNPQPIPVLDAAAAWAQRERLDHLYARLSFTRAEEWMNADKWKQAAAALQSGQSRLNDAATGLLGNWSRYLEARVLAELGKESAVDVLNASIANHYNMSSRFMQLQTTNRWFDDQLLRASVAVEIYENMLSDPGPRDWAFRPLDTLAMLKAPLEDSYDRWIAALGERKEKAAAIEVADLAKRRRFFNALELGGRLASIRDTLESPENMLSPSSRSLRNDLLLRYPEYAGLAKDGQALHQQLRTQWKPTDDKAGSKALDKLWRSWANNLNEREILVSRLGLSRAPSEFQFPPVVAVEDLQARLQPGQVVVVFHETAGELMGFLLTDSTSTIWNCGTSAALGRDVSKFLADLGNHDRNNSLDEKELASTDWRESGEALFQALFTGSSLDLATVTELIVVPDSVVWYVPLGALPLKVDGEPATLNSVVPIRVVPTMGLAVGQAAPWRRILHTTIAGSEIVPGDKVADREAELANLQAVMPSFISLPAPLPESPPVVATVLDALLSLNEIDIERAEPFLWSPIAAGRGEEGQLGTWVNLPRIGPQRLLFPGAHTIAEKGGKASRKRNDNMPPGSELFIASCSLMSSGAQTILLSRWRVGGQSTLELMREFIQELPRTSAVEAWQRCVEVAKELPLEPALEPRVKLKDASTLPTAEHPFFWSGYLLVDAGEPLEAQTLPEVPVVEEKAKPADPTPVQGKPTIPPQAPVPVPAK